MNNLAVLAQNFTLAIKYLEQPIEEIKSSKIRENHLQTCKEVFSKSMPLKEIFIKKVLFMLIHNFTDKKLLETEILALLETAELLLMNYEPSIIKKIFQEEIEMIALLITQILCCFKNGNKTITFKSASTVNKIISLLSKKHLKDFLPKLSSEYFKILNREYKVNKSTIVIAIQGLSKIILTLDVPQNEIKPENYMAKFKNILNNNNIHNTQANDESDKSYQHLTEFFKIIYCNIEKNNYSDKIANCLKKFIIETIPIFFQTHGLKWLILIFLYVENISFEKSDDELNKLINTFENEPQSTLEKIYTILKENILTNIKKLEKIHLSLDSNYFLKTFGVLKSSFRVLSKIEFFKFELYRENTNYMKFFSFNEANSIVKIFSKAFSLKSLNIKKIEVMDPIEFTLFFNINELERYFIVESEEKLFNFQIRKIIDNFEIMNYDEKVFFSVNDMFLECEFSLAIYMFEYYFEKLSELIYCFENHNYIKEIISLLFLLNQIIGKIIGFSMFSRKWLDFMMSSKHETNKLNDQTNSLLVKYIEILLNFDYFPVEDMRDQINEYKILFEMLKIEAIIKTFSVVDSEYQAYFLHRFNILYFFLEKYVENDSFIQCLIEKSLAYFIFCLEKQTRILDFLNKYISNIINRVILQIQSIHLLENKLQPFKVFRALLNLIENDHNGIFMFHMFCMEVWATLIKCYDKYYILSEQKFVYLILGIIEKIIRILIKKPEMINYNNSQDENISYNEVNLIRQILMRIKPLTVSKNKEIFVLANQVFKESLFLIHNKKLIVEEKPYNFSPEDSPNVSIPDSLGPIAYEFLPNYLYLLKNYKNLLGVFKTIEIFQTISLLNLNFFKNGHRFCKEIWPLLKNFVEKTDLDVLKTNLAQKICMNICEFIKNIKLYEDSEFSSSCCKQSQEEFKLIRDYFLHRKILI